MNKDEDVEVGNSTPHEKNVFSSSEKKLYHFYHIHAFLYIFFLIRNKKMDHKKNILTCPWGLTQEVETRCLSL